MPPRRALAAWRGRGPTSTRACGRDSSNIWGSSGIPGIAAEAARPSLAEGRVPAAFAGIDWGQEWRSGDPERGRDLFRATTGVSCVACHRFRGEGGQNGPSLEEADKRLSAPVHGRVDPGAGRPGRPAVSSLGHRASVGRSPDGIILQEGPKVLTLGLTDGTTRELAVADIEERKAASTSIMPEGLVKYAAGPPRLPRLPAQARGSLIGAISIRPMDRAHRAYRDRPGWGIGVGDRGLGRCAGGAGDGGRIEGRWPARTVWCDGEHVRRGGAGGAAMLGAQGLIMILPPLAT